MMIKFTLFMTLLIWILFSSLVVLAVQLLSLTLCDPVDCSTPAFPVLHYLSLLKLMSIGASPVAQLVKNLPANTGGTRDVDLIPGLGRFPGKGNGNPLQYSCLENSMNRVAWLATVH